MNDNRADFMAGLIIGMVMMFAIVFFAEPEWVQPARKAKQECELNIPRNETCVIIALPRSKD